METAPQKILTATIILTALPAYLYFITYENELGICDTLKIPHYLIEPSVSTVLSFGVTMFSFGISLFYIINAIIPMRKAARKPQNSHLKMILFINSYAIVISWFIFYVNPLNWFTAKLIIAVFLGLNLLYWVLPLIFRIRKKQPIKEKLAGIVAENPIVLFDELEKSFQPKDFKIILFCFFLMPGICYFLGKSTALKNVNYELISNSTNKVILRKYGDNLICGIVDLKKKVLTDSIEIVKVNDKEPTKLRTVKIGPLIFD